MDNARYFSFHFAIFGFLAVIASTGVVGPIFQAVVSGFAFCNASHLLCAVWFRK